MIEGLGLIFRNLLQRSGIDIIDNTGWEIVEESTGGLLMEAEGIVVEGEDEEVEGSTEVGGVAVPKDGMLVEKKFQSIIREISSDTVPMDSIAINNNRHHHQQPLSAGVVRILNLTALVELSGHEMQIPAINLENSMTVEVVATVLEMKNFAGTVRTKILLKVDKGVEIIPDIVIARADLGVEIHRCRAVGGKNTTNTVVKIVRVEIEVAAVSGRGNRRNITVIIIVITVPRRTMMNSMIKSTINRTTEIITSIADVNVMRDLNPDENW
jgi:hypothetical protein